ncbi:hypothetical protein [Pseudokineococcus sp. 1T1Z-3]|uniref:hypothetical protein n=1 Tax=Pseudokineococcus sp. 1T1Z-3 TaxID=3132745 RepID=UPI003096C21F
MSEGATSGALVVDVEGLPTSFSTQSRRMRRFVLGYLVAVVLAVVLQVVVTASEGGGGFGYVLAAIWAFVFVGGAVTYLAAVHERQHLEPGGVRRRAAVGRGCVTPWADVAEVRPADTYSDTPYLRGHGRFGDTTPLIGMTDDQARELQRRLEVARAAAG